MPPALLKSWIDELQASGRYSFLRSEAVQNSGLTPNAVSKALRQAAKDGRIVRLKEYAYVIVPLEYRAAGAPPPSWFIHDLMTTMELPYYVGLLSAAALHGASHQQPQVFQVMTDRSVRPIPVGRTKLQFLASKYVSRAAVKEMKTPTGMIRVSTPETTVVDLVRFAKAAGHLDHVAALIAELSPALDPKRLIASVRAVDDIPNAQRLGYILDRVRRRAISDVLHAWVEPRIQRTQLLRPGRPANGATEDRRWRLLINSPLEMEHEKHPVSRAQFEQNLHDKQTDAAFMEDIAPLLSASTKYDPSEAVPLVHDALIARLPGDPWRGTSGPAIER